MMYVALDCARSMERVRSFLTRVTIGDAPVAVPEKRMFRNKRCLDQNTGLETNVSADTTNLPPKLESACNEKNSQPELTEGLFSALKE